MTDLRYSRIPPVDSAIECPDMRCVVRPCVPLISLCIPGAERPFKRYIRDSVLLSSSSVLGVLDMGLPSDPARSIFVMVEDGTMPTR